MSPKTENDPQPDCKIKKQSTIYATLNHSLVLIERESLGLLTELIILGRPMLYCTWWFFPFRKTGDNYPPPSEMLWPLSSESILPLLKPFKSFYLLHSENLNDLRPVFCLYTSGLEMWSCCETVAVILASCPRSCFGSTIYAWFHFWKLLFHIHIH